MDLKEIRKKALELLEHSENFAEFQVKEEASEFFIAILENLDLNYDLYTLHIACLEDEEIYRKCQK
ncbi:hypothetical protein [Clostridium sardiniense]|uniref:hypothetical protein n=1 Tax=Clostridium sardiniense TaxID=29369 RepID=UPI001959853F|nr:hypothetical protein [Clostridium sardiniense]MBM7835972.1 hypothetical protein [Clostridium sardiniense]